MAIIKRRGLLALLLCVCILPVWPARYASAKEKRTENADSRGQAAMDLELYARGAVLMDGDSGRILYGKNASEALPMASTTKIMTCILALEQGGGEKQVCTVSAAAASQPQVKLGLTKGDTFYLGDLLYSLMLESHNDTAVCIAENVGGSVEDFAAMMNRKAEELGCADTYYITPNGLDAEDENGAHRTTAAELARVMRYCITQSPMAERFLEITRTDAYTFTNVKGTRSYSCVNHNAFLHMMEGALSGKTGFTGNAGYCYVGAVKQGEKLLIAALLACGWPNNKHYKWEDMRKLTEYGFSAYEKKKIGSEPLDLAPVPVENGKEPAVAAEAEVRPFSLLLRPGEQVVRTVTVRKTLKAPVSAGAQIGTVTYSLDGEVLASYPVVTAGACERTDFLFCLKRVTEEFLRVCPS